MNRKPYRRHSLEWSLGCHNTPHDQPRKWVPANVPGGAQLDWANAHDWQDLHFGAAWRQYLGLEDLFWTYRAIVDRASLNIQRDQQLHFVCEGIDYECDVLIDGELVKHQIGMHQLMDLDISSLSHETTKIEIRVYPAPKADTADAWGEEWARGKRSQANRVTKPSISYGDDFHPRVIPLGIWQDAYLEVRPATHITSTHISYRLADDLTAAKLHAEVELNQHPASGTLLLWSIRDADGNEVLHTSAPITERRFTLPATLTGPRLWWPHDHGEPHLYSSELQLLEPGENIQDSQHSSFGIRRLRLVMHDGAWDFPDPTRWPKTRSNPPMTIEVNNRKIFARGACCVPINIFFGTVTTSDCEELVQAAKAANFNLLRNSGGCVAFKESFYEICDREGLMVWQDFPLACNQYPDDAEYLALLDDESRAMIRRLRQHPSIALWCGGNELFEVHSGMTDQSLALRLLNKNTFELDPDRPFLPSTPILGVAHGPYEFASQVGGKTVEAVRSIQEAANTAFPEFGCPAPAPVESLTSFIPSPELFPPRAGTSWEDHKGFFAFVEREETWLNLPLLEHYCGPIKSLAQLVECGQQMQGQSLKAIFEEARRKQPMCALALMWCLNEPWPNAANLSLLSWRVAKKAGYADVAAACRPVLSSARVKKFLWQPGELFEAELWMLSDSPRGLDTGYLQVWLGETAESAITIGDWTFPSLQAQENQRGPTLTIALPHFNSNSFRLLLRCPERPELDSDYQYWIRQ